MNYCVQIWGQKSNSHLNKIKSLQNSALKILNFKPFRYNADPLYISSNIMPLSKSVSVSNLLFVFNFFQNNLPCYFSNFFTLSSSRHEHFTRNHDTILVLPKFKIKKYGRLSAKYQCVSVWNNNINLIKNKFNQNYLNNNRHTNFLSLNYRQFFKLIIQIL